MKLLWGSIRLRQNFFRHSSFPHICRFQFYTWSLCIILTSGWIVKGKNERKSALVEGFRCDTTKFSGGEPD